MHDLVSGTTNKNLKYYETIPMYTQYIRDIIKMIKSTFRSIIYYANKIKLAQKIMARVCEWNTNKFERSDGKTTIKIQSIGCNMTNKMTKVCTIISIYWVKKNEY